MSKTEEEKKTATYNPFSGIPNIMLRRANTRRANIQHPTLDTQPDPRYEFDDATRRPESTQSHDDELKQETTMFKF